ncbi:MAG: chemotaxis protein CheX [SAR324 cluster bacterium]|nr:chemotaxis protein CheX [SAR324 cluster bacterium]
MSEAAQILSKVLIHEIDPDHMQKLREFCQTHNLIGLKAEQYKNIRETLEHNIDLGAIFLCEDAKLEGRTGIEIAQEIHHIRPELPIFMRRISDTELPHNEHISCAGFYKKDELDVLQEHVNKFIFNTYYPTAMIHGIEELSEIALNSVLKDVTISVGAPYLVRDRIIYGELFSIISLEGGWCRGFMMLQSEEASLYELVRHGKTPMNSDEGDFRSVNGLMGEITNMMWGGFKSRFFSNTNSGSGDFRIQVPTIINHSRNYISFGSEDPQLCFHYTITDNSGKLAPISLYQKFIFHLSWSPDEFKEAPDAMDSLVQAGELELF